MESYVAKNYFDKNATPHSGNSTFSHILSRICVFTELVYFVLFASPAFSANLLDDKAAYELVQGLGDHKNVSELNKIITDLRGSQNLDGTITQIEKSIYFVSLDKHIKYKTFPDRYTDIITLANSSYIVRIYIDRSAQLPILDMSAAKAKKTDEDYSINPVMRDP